MPEKQISRSGWRALTNCFVLTESERWVLAGIMAIVMLGLVSRYIHMRTQTAAPYQPEGIEQTQP